jgi:hypothetical protein
MRGRAMTDETSEPELPARNFWDEWELEARQRMVFDYGHSYDSAAALAMHMRYFLQAELNRPMPLSLYIGGI